MSENEALLTSERRDQIVTLLRAGTTRVAALATELGVTPTTIRRDLTVLEDEGVIERVHGGATLVAHVDHTEPAPKPESGRRAKQEPEPNGHIAMLVPDLDFYWPGIVQGAQASAAQLGVRLSLRGGSYEDPDERPILEQLAAADDVLGLLVAPNMGGPHASEVIEWLHGCGLPWVLVEREAVCGPWHMPVESVVSDAAFGGIMAVNHLSELGHRRIGLVLSRTSPTTARIRKGWEQAVADHGIADDCFVEMVWDHRSPDFGQTARRVVDRAFDTGATALFVHSDREAMALGQHLQARGLSIPQDLSLIVYDDELAALFNPPLTAIRPARRAVGVAATKLLWDRIHDPTRPVHRTWVTPLLTIRESTAPPRQRQP
ncbi:MAG: substrate-binding domain-containing protein [Propionibacteriaceae bacterium]|nr:substrate-binding domain-containing protein [Propionibacteriaceae bacterium]